MNQKLKILIFGSSGLIGSGVRDTCLEDPKVESVTTIGRKRSGIKSSKLTEIIHNDLMDYSSIEEKMTGFDACFWCIGISYSQVKDEGEYTLVTKDYPLEAAKVLKDLNPDMTFIYVSGAGANIESKTKWARIKGEAEKELREFGFKQYFNVRPASVQSVNGVKHRLLSYRIGYILNPILNLIFPRFILTNKQIGEVLLLLTRKGSEKKTLESGDMNDLINEHSLT
jgi:uncharacterized protein YbjT (DUF2867 family)